MIIKEVTRAHKGWALDSVVLQNQITRFNKEDINESPSEGVYVHGLFLEGKWCSHIIIMFCKNGGLLISCANSHTTLDRTTNNVKSLL